MTLIALLPVPLFAESDGFYINTADANHGPIWGKIDGDPQTVDCLKAYPERGVVRAWSLGEKNLHDFRQSRVFCREMTIEGKISAEKFEAFDHFSYSDKFTVGRTEIDLENIPVGVDVLYDEDKLVDARLRYTTAVSRDQSSTSSSVRPVYALGHNGYASTGDELNCPQFYIMTGIKIWTKDPLSVGKQAEIRGLRVLCHRLYRPPDRPQDPGFYIDTAQTSQGTTWGETDGDPKTVDCLDAYSYGGVVRAWLLSERNWRDFAKSKVYCRPLTRAGGISTSQYHPDKIYAHFDYRGGSEGITKIPLDRIPRGIRIEYDERNNALKVFDVALYHCDAGEDPTEVWQPNTCSYSKDALKVEESWFDDYLDHEYDGAGGAHLVYCPKSYVMTGIKLWIKDPFSTRKQAEIRGVRPLCHQLYRVP
jgi:hypothetical protein